MDDSIFLVECDNAIQRLKLFELLTARALDALNAAKLQINVENKYAVFKEFIALNAVFLEFLEKSGVSLQTMNGAMQRVKGMQGNFFGADLCSAALKVGF